MNLNNLMKEVLKLSYNDKKKLYSFIGGTLTEKDKKDLDFIKKEDFKKSVSAEYNLFYKVLLDCFKDRGIKLPCSIELLNRSNETLEQRLRNKFESFNKSLKETPGYEYYLDGIGSNKELNILYTTWRFVSFNILDYMEEKEITITFKSFINLLDQWQGIIAQHFPGYLSNGMFWFLIGETFKEVK